MQGKGSAERRMEDIMGYDTETRERLHHGPSRGAESKLEGGRDTECALIEVWNYYPDHEHVRYPGCSLESAMSSARREYAQNDDCSGWQVVVIEPGGKYRYTQPEHEKRARSIDAELAGVFYLIEEAGRRVVGLSKRLQEREAF